MHRPRPRPRPPDPRPRALTASRLLQIKGSFSMRRGVSNPYSRGNACANCWHVLCGPLAPSLIDRRGALPPDEPPAPVLLAPVSLPAPAPAPALALASYTNLFEGEARHAYMNRSLDLDPVPLQGDRSPR